MGTAKEPSEEGRSELRADLTLDFEQVQGKRTSEALVRFPFWLPLIVKGEMPQTTARTRTAEDAKAGQRESLEPVELHMDLFPRGPFRLQTFLSSLLNKVEESCGSLRLCRKLHNEEMPFNSFMEILKALDLDFIEELEVFDWFRVLSGQSLFANQLGRMCSLRSLKLYHCASPSKGRLSSSYFFSQLSKLGHLQKLHLSYSHLSGNLHQVLSCLQTPLLTLEIRSCALMDTDNLSQSCHTTCLKKLDLSGSNLSHMVPGPLETLLKASGTLQRLDLNHCRLKDAHLRAILLALHHCSCLSSLSDNPGLPNLLEHPVGLVELEQVFYPIPIECCMYLHGLFCCLIKGKLCQVQAELQELLQAMQQADMHCSPSLPSPLPVRLVKLH
ncbi:LOW QUALITY PROTEIN: melanoma antigen preferentially expressed in tumors [Rhynchonycteris naso]